MEKIKAFFNNLGFSIRITYQAAHTYFIWKLLLSFACSVLPFVEIYFWKNIINVLLEIKNADAAKVLVVNSIAYMAAYILSRCLMRVSQVIEYKYNDMVSVYVENILLDKFSEVDLAFYDSSEQANKLSYTWEIKHAMTNLATIFFYSAQIFVSFLLSLILLARLNGFYALLLLLLSVPVFWCKIRSNTINRSFSEETQKTNREMGYFKNLFRNVTCMYDIKLYGLKAFFLGKYTDSWVELYRKRKELTWKVTALTFASLLLSTFVNQILLYAIVIHKLLKKVFQIGDATYFISVYNQFNENLAGLISMASGIQYAFSQLVVIKEFMEMEPDIPKSGTLIPDTFQSLTFSHVYFKYPGKDAYILQDCSFTIEKGQTIGLVGENGSGKSTIVKLLLRLYDIDQGQILLNGIDIKEYDTAKYRSMFSALFQDFIEYSFTLRENIALSHFAELQNDEKINDAIDKSELREVIQSWAKGLETPLTRGFEPDGKELSGGQWQRVALARVFFADRNFIVLDEPSASLDVFAEEKIFREFKHLSNHRTSVIISHRLSSIVHADVIIVLKDGKIVENGSHKELLDRNGYYAELFKLQASRYV